MLKFPPFNTRIILLLFAFTAFFFPSHTSCQYGTGVRDTFSMQHQDVIRKWNVYTPNTYTGEEAVPLVMVLHPGQFMFDGSDTMNLIMENYTHFDLVADTANFVICYPNSRKGAHTIDFWAQWDETNRWDWNDVDFLNQVMDSVIHDYNIDSCRVYMTGLSKGAFMTYTMAAEASDRIAAIAPVSGQTRSNYEYTPSRAMPIFHIHGTHDPQTPYEGIHLSDMDSVRTTLSFWANYNGCAPIPEISYIYDASLDDGCQIEQQYFAPIADNEAEILHYKILGGGHAWPGANFEHPAEDAPRNMDIDASVEIWNFFRQYALCEPAVVSSTTNIPPANLSVYPNPAYGQINIQIDRPILFVNFYSIDGKLLASAPFSQQMDISNLPNGLLILEMVDELGHRSNTKIYKQ